MSRSEYADYKLHELKEIVWEYCLTYNSHKIPADFGEQAEWLDKMRQQWRFASVDPFLAIALDALINDTSAELWMERLRRLL